MEALGAVRKAVKEWHAWREGQLFPASFCRKADWYEKLECELSGRLGLT